MRTYTLEELTAFESQNDVALPQPLRHFLLSHGAGAHRNAMIYEPEKVQPLYAEFFDDPSELFRTYLPFGEHTAEQVMLVYRITDGKYASIWHETVPEDWPEEEWSSFTPEALRALAGV
jgi:hypothetical protein